jgi:hypothetical protein
MCLHVDLRRIVSFYLLLYVTCTVSVLFFRYSNSLPNLVVMEWTRLHLCPSLRKRSQIGCQRTTQRRGVKLKIEVMRNRTHKQIIRDEKEIKHPVYYEVEAREKVR